MQLLIYILIYPIIWIISILPFPVLYFLSDCVFFLVYRIIKYRKRVVRQNIALSLTHLSDQERKIIEKKFYSHMCDLYLEMIKTLSISRKEIEKRFVFTNMEVYLELEKKEKWPSAGKVKLHEAKRMLLGWLLNYSLYYVELEGAKAIDFLMNELTCREADRILIQKCYQLN